MNLAISNFSTGPVNITREVQMALASSPISHRSAAFSKLFNHVQAQLCEHFITQSVFILSGSGTAANEAMLAQVKARGGTGLVLANGEFGTRLVTQARRAGLTYIAHSLPYGEGFDIDNLVTRIKENEIKWVLFCHCETSTGQLNDLPAIAAVCLQHHCLCFVDCMSTAGTIPLDLSGVSMATASSGKGLAAVPGLGIIFSNISLVIPNDTALYFDLAYYAAKQGIPFTISSNLICALQVSMHQKLQPSQFQLVQHYSTACFDILMQKNLLPYPLQPSKVFSISPLGQVPVLVNNLKKKNIIVSSESEYLKKRSLCQLAFFGYYKAEETENLIQVLNTLQPVTSV